MAWKGIIPEDEPYSFVVQAEAFKAAVRRVMTTTDTFMLNRVIKLVLGASELQLASRGSDLGLSNEAISINCPNLNGSTVELGLNGTQILDFLSMAKEEVVVDIWDEKRPVRFRLPSVPFSFQYISQPTRF